MFGSKHKRKTSRIDTLVGPNTMVYGDIKYAGGLHIEGVIKGNVIADNDDTSMLQLSEQGRIEGDVNVPYIILNGHVKGDVRGRVHIDLLSRSQVNGNVYYNLIEMAIGAEVNGKLVHSVEIETTQHDTDTDDIFEVPEQNT